MIGSFECIVLDCPDSGKLARFYQAIIGGVVNQPDPRWSLSDDWATLHADRGLVLAFQTVASYQRPDWPDPGHPQQFHLDLSVPDLDQAERDVVALGGTLLEAGDAGRIWRVFADPAGHPFCLVVHSTTVTGEPAAARAPLPLAEERAQEPDVFGLGELERSAMLAWVGENLPLVRRSVSGHRILYRVLIVGFLVGLAAHVGGFLLKTSATTEPLSLVADLLYALGWALWTSVVVVTFVQIWPEAKKRQYKQALDAYEAATGRPARVDGARVDSAHVDSGHVPDPASAEGA